MSEAAPIDVKGRGKLMRHEGKHILSHTGIYLIARGVPGIISFLSIYVFSRLLNPTDYGHYALVIATVGFLNALLFQWLRLSLVRYLPAYKDDPVRLKSTLASAMLFLIVVLGVVIAVAFVIPIFRPWRTVLFPCWIMLGLQAVFELNNEYSRAMIQPWRYMTLQLMRSCSAILLGVLFIKIGMKWWGPLAALAVGMGLGCVYAVRKDWSDIRFIIDRETLKKLWHYGAPLSMTVALTVVIGTSDRFLIAWKLGDAAAGLYSVAMDFTVQTLTLLMMVINMAMFPLAVRAWEYEGRAAAQERMGANAALLLAVGLPAVIGISLLATGISHNFLGKDFRVAAAGIMPMVALGTFLAGFKAYHFDAAFQFAHRTIYQVWIVLFAALVNVALNLIAIPRWGINGAAAASAVAYLVSIVLTATFGRRHFALPFPLRPTVQVLAASLCMTIVLLPLRQVRGPVGLTASIGGAAFVYLFVLIASGFLGLREQLLLKWRDGQNFPAEPNPIRSDVVATSTLV